MLSLGTLWMFVNHIYYVILHVWDMDHIKNDRVSMTTSASNLKCVNDKKRCRLYMMQMQIWCKSDGSEISFELVNFTGYKHLHDLAWSDNYWSGCCASWLCPDHPQTLTWLCTSHNDMSWDQLALRTLPWLCVVWATFRHVCSNWCRDNIWVHEMVHCHFTPIHHTSSGWRSYPDAIQEGALDKVVVED